MSMMELPKTGRLACYPLKGPKSLCTDRFKLHSLPKDAQAKREGQFTAKVDFLNDKSGFGPKQFDARHRAEPCHSVGDPSGPGPDRDRFKMDSLPKETVKKLHGLFSTNVDFIEPKSGFGPDNPFSEKKNLPAYSFGGGSGVTGRPLQSRNRFKYDSLDKDVIKRQYGTQTPSHVDYLNPQSSFGQNRVLSGDIRLPAYSLGGPGGVATGKGRNRFKYDSLPKETVKKYFGLETKHIGFIDAPKSFGTNKPLSNEPNCDVPVLGERSGPNPNVNRFKVHSMPKETVKKLHGIHTSGVDYIDAPNFDRGVSAKTFAKTAKLQQPLGGNTQVNDDYFWRTRVASEQRAMVKSLQRPTTADAASVKGARAATVLGASASSPALIRQARYDKMRSNLKTPKAAKFADTLSTLDKKLQAFQFQAKGADPTVTPNQRNKAEQAVKSLKGLVDQIKTLQLRRLKYSSLDD